MKKFTVALAAISAVLAVSGTALANDVANELVYPSKSPRSEQAQRPEKIYALDFLSTKSIVENKNKNRKSETRDPPATAPSGIEINPWIVPSFR